MWNRVPAPRSRFAALVLALAGLGLVAPPIAAHAGADSSPAAPADPATGGAVHVPDDATVLHVDVAYAEELWPATDVMGDGSLVKPYPSIAQGVWVAQNLREAGTPVRVVVAPGVYREKVEVGSAGAAPAPLSIEAASPGAVVVTGADVEQRWTEVPGTSLFSAPWLHDWGLSPVPSSWGSTSVNDTVRRREGVYVDWEPLTQVGTEGELTAGEFMVDEAADRILMAPPAGVADPRHHTVEVTARDRALRIHGGARSVQVKGFIFQGGAPGFEKHMVYVSDSTDVLVEGNVLRHSTWGGLGLAGGERITFRGNHAVDNGGNGIDTYKSRNVVVESNRMTGNNTRGLVNGYVGWSTAGSKNLLLHGAVFRGNVYEGNLARGLWFDTDVANVLVDGDRSCDNLSDGVFVEAVQGPLTISDTTFCGNNGAGIRVGTSGNVRVEGSSIIDNRYGILFTGERQRSWWDHITGLLVEMGDFADWTLVGNTIQAPGSQPTISSDVIAMSEWRALLEAGEIVASGNTFVRTPLEGSIQIQGGVFPLADWDGMTGDSVSGTTTEPEPTTTTTEPEPTTTTTPSKPGKGSGGGGDSSTSGPPAGKGKNR